jgi:hypothetical protein
MSDKFEGAKLQSSEFFHADNFDTIAMKRVTFIKPGESPLLSFKAGNSVTINKLSCPTGSDSVPYVFYNIKNTKINE